MSANNVDVDQGSADFVPRPSYDGTILECLKEYQVWERAYSEQVEERSRIC